MRQLVAGNWKMNGLSAASESLARDIVAGARGFGCDLLICPPFTLLSAIAKITRGSAVGLGGQDCQAAACGAFTGDISAEMLTDLGCSAVIVGHSERRQGHHESDAEVCEKAAAAARAGLMPIVCVGETEAERRSGHQAAVVCGQIMASLPDGFAGVVAYEPIWAIGTGLTPSEADVAAIHRDIRKALVERLGKAGAEMRILYGGSVKAENAAGLMAVPEVGGALVGGASLQAEAFLSIAQAAAHQGQE